MSFRLNRRCKKRCIFSQKHVFYVCLYPLKIRFKITFFWSLEIFLKDLFRLQLFMANSAQYYINQQYAGPRPTYPPRQGGSLIIIV